MRTFGRWAALAGLVAAEVGIAIVYLGYGTWWHWLLHQYVGWGVGLSTAALVGSLTRYRVPAAVALVAGQLLSIVPDLQFRYARMPHEPSMDLWLGHISIHTGPSPVLVALGALLLGGWAYVAGTYGRRGPAVALAGGGLVLVTVACLVARDVPTRLQDYPLDTPRVVTSS
ncbi:MAG: hypothetical protein JWN08_3797 [Frankiales bacterium]|nr:hypothetical protein [Frankiales bacterium]